MRFDSPSQWNPKDVSGNVALSPHDCRVYGWFSVLGNGTVTLPVPSYELNGVEIVVVNASAGLETLSCANGFPHNLDTVAVGAGQSVLLICGPVGSGLYKWAVIGGTAA
jgi:hypothetical protein